MGFVAGGLFAFLSHVDSWQRLGVGLAVAFAGLALRGWAAGYLEKGKRLAQDGPYSIWRHPLYAGSTIMALGFCVAGTGMYDALHSTLLWIVLIVLFGWVYPRRIREEEGSLEKYFGDAWRGYVARSHRFLPRLPGPRRPDADRFEWWRYGKNHEYNAFFGFLAGAALLSAKAYLQI
jgi:protein-S-isoprenylcysteine O-methyltransferase Ste14